MHPTLLNMKILHNTMGRNIFLWKDYATLCSFISVYVQVKHYFSSYFQNYYWPNPCHKKNTRNTTVIKYNTSGSGKARTSQTIWYDHYLKGNEQLEYIFYHFTLFHMANTALMPMENHMYIRGYWPITMQYIVTKNHSRQLSCCIGYWFCNFEEKKNH